MSSRFTSLSSHGCRRGSNVQNGDIPAAAAAFSIGTAKPMPMKTRCLVGLRMAGHDADHLAVGRDQRSARIARIGRSVELDQICEHALAFGRPILAPQAGYDAGCHRRADTEGESRRQPLRHPARRSAVERNVAGVRSSGTVFAWITARSCSGRAPITVASASRPSEKTTRSRFALDDNVQVRENGAVVEDHDTAADTALGILVRIALAAEAAHAYQTAPFTSSYACAAREGNGFVSSVRNTAASMSFCVKARGGGFDALKA